MSPRKNFCLYFGRILAFWDYSTIVKVFEEQREVAKENYSQADAIKSIASQMKNYDGDRD